MAFSQVMFVDRIKVFAQAGNGGRGCVSFRREKFVPKGGPDGGDGGRGGDIILRADRHTDHLAHLFYEPIIKAKNGGHGRGKKMHGKNATDKIVKVPVGTMVYQLRSVNDGMRFEGEQSEDKIPNRESSIDDGEIEEQPRRFTDGQSIHDQSTIDAPQSDLLADLTSEGQEFLLCKGGAGGKGNVHFKSSRNRAPREYTEGGEGESGHFLLELRSIADVGLVGYPNAGKSTLIQQLSAARSRIAPYPFTTLHPVIGIVELGDYRRATVADIPGLIEGAHRNLGLGHDFLRHITRCRLFLFVLDISGSEGRSPIADLESLRREIALYDPRLSDRPWFIIANKMDLPEAEENLRDFKKRFPQRTIVVISAKEGRGINELKRLLKEWMDQHSELVTGQYPAEGRTD
ncbi:MAG TPA: GTPase ObgE [Candidatus Kapabacteria bacterium]|nr:GTPase ObgE [Candidatus Kapabacteria bacterium]